MTINVIYSLVHQFLMLMGQLLREDKCYYNLSHMLQTTHSYGCPAGTQPTSPRDPP